MRIIYEDSEGLKQIIPSPHYKGTIEELAIKRVPKGLDYKIINEAELPDRTFRNAWSLEGRKVVEKIDKAKEIHKNKLRIDRTDLFTRNDIKIQDALLNKDDKLLSLAVKEKERLKDITKEVDKCKTIDEIKKVKV